MANKYCIVLLYYCIALIIKAKVPESHGDIHNYGKHPTPQKINAYIVNKNSTK